MNNCIAKAIKICGSQKNLAIFCGVAQPTVYKWLNDGGINAKYIPLIAKATNNEVSAEEILKSLSDT